MRSLQRLALAAAPCAFAAACALGAHRTPDVRLPAAYEAPPGAPLKEAALDRWWLLFADPELNALEDQAFRLAPDAKTAAARLLEARATWESEVASLLPTGGLSGKVNRESAANLAGQSNQLFPIGGVTDTETLNFNVSWELDLFGRLRTQYKTAGANFAATRFDIEGERASLAASVADDYFQARGLAIQLDDANTNDAIAHELADLALRKASLGLGAASDADRAEADAEVARAQAVDLAAQLQAAKRSLLILVGRGIDPTSSVAAAAWAPDPPALPAALPGELLTRRPDVREAQAKLTAEIGTQRLQHLAVFPTFTIQPGLGLSRTTAPGVAFIPPATLIPQQQTTSLGFWSLGLAATQPILDIPRLMATARAEDARTEEAVIAYEKTVQTAYGEAENDLAGMAADKRRLAILTDAEARAHRAYVAARERYARGLDDLTSALTAEEAWRNTRSTLTGARVAALRRAVQTYKALGGGWAYTAPETRGS
ncbi:MAG TPA: efflux transporter outer membrane subunit [Caulobacteraceae bacterium]|nr:efflux transporter outer membrane subunit [Caulobacteraceae bacterium]